MKQLLYFITISVFLVSCSPSEPEQIEIPFKYNRHLYLNCKVGDSLTGNFLFDTGAYGLYIDSTYNQTSGYKFDPAGPPKIYDPNNMICEQNQSMPSLSCPPVSYTAGYAWVINPKQSFGKKCDGIVGWDFIKNYAVKIDYQKEKMTLIASENFVELESYKKTPLRRLNNWFIVDLEITISENLKIKGPFIFDTGYSGSVALTGETTRRYQLDTISNKKVQYALDWRVIDKVKSMGNVTRVQSIKLDEFELKEPLIDFFNDEIGILGKGEYLGLLGNDFLDHFDVIIDFPNDVAYLKPNSDYKKRMRFKNIGVALVDRTDICEGWIVSGITAGSKAQQEGVRYGDLLTHINGKAAKNNDSEKMLEELYKTVGKTSVMSFKRKDSTYQLSLTLEEKLK